MVHQETNLQLLKQTNKWNNKIDKLIMFSIYCVLPQCVFNLLCNAWMWFNWDQLAAFQLHRQVCSSSSNSSSSSDCSTVWRNVFSHSVLSSSDICWLSKMTNATSLTNYRPGRSRIRWKYMLIKFATWLSTLFVFCRNNLHLLLFSFFHSSPVPPAYFP